MSTTKHTKGPWEIQRATNGIPYRITSPNSDDKKPGSVGKHVTRWGCLMNPSSEEGEANARLIAAAPELLAFAEKFDRWADLGGYVPDSESDDEIDNLLAESRMIIKLATQP